MVVPGPEHHLDRTGRNKVEEGLNPAHEIEVVVDDT